MNRNKRSFFGNIGSSKQNSEKKENKEIFSETFIAEINELKAFIKQYGNRRISRKEKEIFSGILGAIKIITDNNNDNISSPLTKMKFGLAAKKVDSKEGMHIIPVFSDHTYQIARKVALFLEKVLSDFNSYITPHGKIALAKEFKDKDGGESIDEFKRLLKRTFRNMNAMLFIYDSASHSQAVKSQTVDLGAMSNYLEETVKETAETYQSLSNKSANDKNTELSKILEIEKYIKEKLIPQIEQIANYQTINSPETLINQKTPVTLETLLNSIKLDQAEGIRRVFTWLASFDLLLNQIKASFGIKVQSLISETGLCDAKLNSKMLTTEQLYGKFILCLTEGIASLGRYHKKSNNESKKIIAQSLIQTLELLKNTLNSGGLRQDNLFLKISNVLNDIDTAIEKNIEYVANVNSNGIKDKKGWTEKFKQVGSNVFNIDRVSLGTLHTELLQLKINIGIHLLKEMNFRNDPKVAEKIQTIELNIKIFKLIRLINSKNLGSNSSINQYYQKINLTEFDYRKLKSPSRLYNYNQFLSSLKNTHPDLYREHLNEVQQQNGAGSTASLFPEQEENSITSHNEVTYPTKAEAKNEEAEQFTHT